LEGWKRLAFFKWARPENKMFDEQLVNSKDKQKKAPHCIANHHSQIRIYYPYSRRNHITSEVLGGRGYNMDSFGHRSLLISFLSINKTEEYGESSL
jgi:hypothetical protein